MDGETESLMATVTRGPPQATSEGGSHGGPYLNSLSSRPCRKRDSGGRSTISFENQESKKPRRPIKPNNMGALKWTGNTLFMGHNVTNNSNKRTSPVAEEKSQSLKAVSPNYGLRTMSATTMGSMDPICSLQLPNLSSLTSCTITSQNSPFRNQSYQSSQSCQASQSHQPSRPKSWTENLTSQKKQDDESRASSGITTSTCSGDLTATDLSCTRSQYPSPSGTRSPGDFEDLPPRFSRETREAPACVSSSETNRLQKTEFLSGRLPDWNWPPHGHVSVCGRRPEMEDAVAAHPAFTTTGWKVASKEGIQKGLKEKVSMGSGDMGVGVKSGDEPLHFFGVYDGHGGWQAAKHCAEKLHITLSEELKRSSIACEGTAEELRNCMGRALESTFFKIDAEINGFCLFPGNCGRGKGNCCKHEAIAPEFVGSTAVVAVVSQDQIFVANCGDSRAVLCRGGMVLPLSSDHKPQRPDEMRRVEAAGGKVIYQEGFRVLGVLAMSRAIGDRVLKPYVISKPEMTYTMRAEQDDFIILASDGLWDVLSNEIACKIVGQCLEKRRKKQGDDGQGSPCSMAAALLTKVALARGSTDNISVVVVDLQSQSPS